MQERLAGARNLPEVRQVARRDKVEEERENRGHEVSHGDAPAGEGVLHNGEVEVGAVGDYDRGAAEVHRHPHLWYGAIERQGRLKHKSIGPAKAEQFSSPVEAVPYAARWHNAALRTAGGSGGVHDVHHLGGRPRPCRLAHLHDGRVARAAEFVLSKGRRPHQVEYATLVVELNDGADLFLHEKSLNESRLLVPGFTVDDHNRCIRLGQDVDSPCCRPRRIARDKGGSGCEAGGLRERQRGGAAKDEPNRKGAVLGESADSACCHSCSTDARGERSLARGGLGEGDGAALLTLKPKIGRGVRGMRLLEPLAELVCALAPPLGWDAARR
eukprot:scaffold180942_cov28-Tisochrysis_lutea.AAC.1